MNEPARKGKLRLPPGIGKAGEAAAAAYLAAHGWCVLERNFRTREGEVDIVASDGNALVFVEVKSRRRRTSAFGAVEESVKAAKLKRVAAAAEAYLSEHGQSGLHWRIDVLLVVLDAAGRTREIKRIENAFET